MKKQLSEMSLEELWELFGYTEAKSDFILKYSNIVKHEFRDWYKPRL